MGNIIYDMYMHGTSNARVYVVVAGDEKFRDGTFIDAYECRDVFANMLLLAHVCKPIRGATESCCTGGGGDGKGTTTTTKGVSSLLVYFSPHVTHVIRVLPVPTPDRKSQVKRPERSSDPAESAKFFFPPGGLAPICRH